MKLHLNKEDFTDLHCKDHGAPKCNTENPLWSNSFHSFNVIVFKAIISPLKP